MPIIGRVIRDVTVSARLRNLFPDIYGEAGLMHERIILKQAFELPDAFLMSVRIPFVSPCCFAIEP
jgi:hypothetical protein